MALKRQDGVVLNPAGIRQALTSAQTKAALLAVSEGIAAAVSAESKHEYKAAISDDQKTARAAVFPITMHGINSENYHHWLNRFNRKE